MDRQRAHLAQLNLPDEVEGQQPIFAKGYVERTQLCHTSAQNSVLMATLWLRRPRPKNPAITLIASFLYLTRGIWWELRDSNSRPTD